MAISLPAHAVTSVMSRVRMIVAVQTADLEQPDAVVAEISVVPESGNAVDLNAQMLATELTLNARSIATKLVALRQKSNTSAAVTSLFASARSSAVALRGVTKRVSMAVEIQTAEVGQVVAAIRAIPESAGGVDVNAQEVSATLRLNGVAVATKSVAFRQKSSTSEAIASLEFSSAELASAGAMVGDSVQVAVRLEAVGLSARAESASSALTASRRI